MKAIICVLAAAWVVVGTTAAQQRDVLGHGLTCDTAATTAVTAAAGPLNYYGVAPRVTCPAPSQ
jgi:hypothetical protein